MANVLDVPYIKQSADWSCAVAALQMAAAFHGVAGLDQDAIYARLKEKSRVAKNQWCVSMQSLANEAGSLGFDVRYLRFEFGDCLEMVEQIRQVTASSPIIAFQRSAMTAVTGHARLIIGIGDPLEGSKMPLVVVHDPATKGVPVGGASRKWKADNFAGMWQPNLSISGGEGIWLVPKGASSSS